MRPYVMFLKTIAVLLIFWTPLYGIPIIGTGVLEIVMSLFLSHKFVNDDFGPPSVTLGVVLIGLGAFIGAGGVAAGIRLMRMSEELKKDEIERARSGLFR